MKKNVFGRKLKRDKDERRALFKSLMSSLILHGKIQTTEAKAKAIKSEIEKLVTKAKKNENSAKKILQKSLSRKAFEKMLKEIAPGFNKRQGGYTRIIKLGKRLGDSAPVVVMEWVEKNEIAILGKEEVKKTDIKSKRKREMRVKKTPEKKLSKPSRKKQAVKKTK